MSAAGRSGAAPRRSAKGRWPSASATATWPRPAAPDPLSCLRFGPVVEDHPAAALVALANDDTLLAVVHRVGIAPVQRLGDTVGNDGGIKVVPWALPDAGVVGERFHAVPVARMGAPDLAE